MSSSNFVGPDPRTINADPHHSKEGKENEWEIFALVHIP